MLLNIVKVVVGSVLMFAVLLAVVLGLIMAWDATDSIRNPPLMLTSESVEGEWPFAEKAVEVICCTRGQISIRAKSGQTYWFTGGVHVERFPVTVLGAGGKVLADFENAHRAAKILVETERPEWLQ